MLLLIGQLKGGVVEEVDEILERGDVDLVACDRGDGKEDLDKETGHRVSDLLLLHLEEVLAQLVQEGEVAHKLLYGVHLKRGGMKERVAPSLQLRVFVGVVRYHAEARLISSQHGSTSKTGGGSKAF